LRKHSIRLGKGKMILWNCVTQFKEQEGEKIEEKGREEKEDTKLKMKADYGAKTVQYK
jgi:hypothetical protein